MNSRILALLSLASVLLLVGCKSEGDKIVEKACDLDLRESENQDICVKALASNCGEFYKEADAAQNELYRLKHWKALFLFEKKGDMDDEEKAKVKEAKTELKEKEQVIRERWDKLPLTSTCKAALENLYDIQWEMMKEKIDKEIKEKNGEESEGLFSTVTGKIKGVFGSKKTEDSDMINVDFKDPASVQKFLAKSDPQGIRNALEKKHIAFNANNFINYAFTSDTLMMTVFLKASFEIDAMSDNGNNAVAIASNKGNVMVLNYLFGHGAKANVKNSNGETVLDNAVMMGRVDVVKILINQLKKEGVDSREMMSAFSVAKKMDNPDILNVFIEAGVSQKAEKKEGYVEESKIIDSRDGKVYQTVSFRGKIWMAQNINYAAESSICYDNAAENCERYGRLYNWTSAKKVCPQGWRLPSEEEWADAPSGIWNTFAGYYYVTKGVFYKKDAAAYYWTSTENDPGKAVDMDMNADSEAFVKKTHSKTDVAFSVRCIKD